MRVGVVGLGTMGSGIVQVIAHAGFEVIALEVSDEAISKGLDRIEKFIKRGIERGKNTASDLESVLKRIETTTYYEDFSTCDLVIEAVTENVSIKQEVFVKLEQVTPAGTVLATNTSGIAIHEIAKVLSTPQRLVGLHFFNPAQRMPLVEIVRPLALQDEILERVQQFCVDIGKEPVVVKDRPGFLVNRLLIPYLNQVAEAFDGGLASGEDLDTAIELGLGYPMGPLKLMDQIGLDVHLAATTSIYEQTFLPEFRPPAILKEMVDTGRKGKKIGSGFYSYSGETDHGKAHKH